MIPVNVDPEIRDAIIEEVAVAVEQGDFRSRRSPSSRRKRDKEDAALWSKAAEAENGAAAQRIRRMKGRWRDSPAEVLAVIAGLDPRDDHAANLLEAWPLAAAGLVTIEAAALVAGPWSNTIPPQTRWTISLTNEGRALLENATKAAT